jgi:hypothetical protein
LSPEAENLNYLLQTPESMKLPLNHPDRIAKGRMYYQRLSTSTNPAWVKRYVMAELGPDPSGAAVYSGMFFTGFHCRDELIVLPGAPLLIGMDLGRDPWALLGQLDHMSRLLIHEEVPADDIGLQLALMNVRRVVNQRRYLGCPVCIIFDPAGLSKSNFDERTSYDVIRSAGFMAIPAPSNRLPPRLNAAEKFMMETRGGTASMLVDKGRCPTLVTGLNGGYRFKYNQILESSPTPEKNRYSHVCDAHQYLCQGASGGTATSIARKVTRAKAMADAGRHVNQVPPSAKGWT